MSKLNFLLEVAEELKLQDVSLELSMIQDRMMSQNKDIIIPIVGEFSAGKTSLLNAISDSKKLETASRPTTAVIYEMFFGSNKEYAELYDNESLLKTVDDLSHIKNEELNNISLIKVFDTSKRVPESTILVDTPGLSSNSPQHIEALSNYLPQADALFLCIDANQQLTKSMIDFLEINSLSHLPIYLIVTKSDTKAPAEIKEIKNYIASNIKLTIEKVITVSAKNNELNEFEELLQEVQSNKNAIVNKALEFKVNATAKYLSSYLTELIGNSQIDKDIKIKLEEKQRELSKIERSVDLLINEVNVGLNNSERNCVKSFENTMQTRLDELIVSNPNNIDHQAFSMVNTLSNVVFSNFKNDVLTKFYALSNDRKYSELGEALRTLQGVDLSDVQIDQLSYNINLEAAGSKAIKNVATGLKIVAGIAAVAVTAGLAAPAVAGTAAATGATTGAATLVNGAVATNTVMNVVDSATDVMNISSNIRTRKAMANMNRISNAVQANMPVINQYDMQMGQMVSPNTKKGFVENIVSKIGDSALGKPQRRKMINEYMSSTLIPEFESQLQMVKLSLLGNIQTSLKSEIAMSLQQYRDNIEELSRLNKDAHEEYKMKVNKYKEYINELKS
ncbi:hypothetical protein HMPREF9714_02405 [Myroides odoratimimus CCUG 12901]|uniref:dynamin family protein n=1 Tax=Myroides odoratimimus TaxID=76832 RepID=UPI000245F902|nr:dynamin family protein [Myroides odoratimimus]EHO07807.1 hypothetical protein HMPREF9714_02405 [Myroides odoratimimus CCUG 12901]